MTAQQPAGIEAARQASIHPTTERPGDRSIWVVTIEACAACGGQANHVSRELRTGAFISYCDHCRHSSSGKENTSCQK